MGQKVAKRKPILAFCHLSQLSILGIICHPQWEASKESMGFIQACI